MKDVIMAGSIAGIAGTLGDTLVHQAGKYLLGTSTTSQFIAQLIFHQESLKLRESLAGFIAHLVVGGAVGVILATILRLTGKDHPYFKGVAVGLFFWVFHVAAISNFVTAPLSVIIRDELNSYVDLVAHLTFGAIATWVLVKHADI